MRSAALQLDAEECIDVDMFMQEFVTGMEEGEISTSIADSGRGGLPGQSVEAGAFRVATPSRTLPTRPVANSSGTGSSGIRNRVAGGAPELSTLTCASTLRESAPASGRPEGPADEPAGERSAASGRRWRVRHRLERCADELSQDASAPRAGHHVSVCVQLEQARGCPGVGGRHLFIAPTTSLRRVPRPARRADDFRSRCGGTYGLWVLPRAVPPASGVPSRVGRFRCSR